MSDDCGTVTEDGNAVCVPGSCSCSPTAKSSESILLSAPVIQESKDRDLPEIVPTNKSQEPTLWKKIRSGVMFGIACIASPCCTPIILPIGIALLAGTPATIWLSANPGWVYGGLTLLSIISLALGFHWMRQKSSSRHSTGTRAKAGQQHIQEVTYL